MMTIEEILTEIDAVTARVVVTSGENVVCPISKLDGKFRTVDMNSIGVWLQILEIKTRVAWDWRDWDQQMLSQVFQSNAVLFPLLYDYLDVDFSGDDFWGVKAENSLQVIYAGLEEPARVQLETEPDLYD